MRGDVRSGAASWLACAAVAAVAACALLAPPARADTRILAKMRCKAQYGSTSDLDAACERGVDLAAPGDEAQALASCTRSGPDSESGRPWSDEEKAAADEKAAACRRGVAFHTGATAKIPDRQTKSSFSHSWEQGHGALQFELGNYDVVLGDAQKSIADCQQSFAGSSVPPSCISGLRIQPKPPTGPPARTAPP